MDVVPRYIYQINDARIKKTIAMERKKNTVVIDYVVENGNKESSLLIKPVFACRDFGSFIDQGDEIKLEAKIDGRDATIINHNDDRYTVKFYTTDGEMVVNARNNCLDDPKVYLMDMKNGYSKSDTGYIPFIVKLDVNNVGNFSSIRY